MSFRCRRLNFQQLAFGRLFVIACLGLVVTGFVLPRSAHASINFIQQATGSVNGGTGFTITLTAAPHIGDALVFQGASQGSHPTSITGGGVTWINATQKCANRCSDIWYGLNSNGNGTTLTVSFGLSQNAGGNVSEWSGIALFGALDVSSGIDNCCSGSDNAPTTQSINTTNPTDLLIGEASVDDTLTITGGPTNSFTALTEVNNGTGSHAVPSYRVVSAASAYSTSWTTSGSLGWDTSIAALKEAPPGLQVSSRSDVLSDSRPSTTSNHTIAFIIQNSLDTTGWGQGSGGDATDTLAIIFPSGFNLANLSCKDVDISFGGTATSIAGYNVNRSTSANCKGSATSWGLFIDTSANTLTFYTPTAAATYVATGTQVQIKIGTNASFQDAATQWITNPSAAGIYTITVGGSFLGSGNILVSINSGVTVQATVAESLALTVSSVKAVNCTADDGATVTAVDTSPTTVSFGVVPLNTFYIGCQDLVVSTNAGNGYSLTTQESSVMKTVNGIFAIPDTTCDAGGCTESAAATWTNTAKNGLGHTCFNQDGNHDCDSSYSNGTKFRQFANMAAGETPQAIMSSTTPATVTARIKHRLSVGAAQAAGTYTTLISYTIYATY